ncbi:MAG: STAS/SEC14 domain-containing protein [Candidatus Omnitrophota bacterium]
MPIKSHWIKYKEKRIYFCDYSNFSDKFELLNEEMSGATEIICQEPEISVLILVDISNSLANARAFNQVKEYMKRSGKHMRAIAVIGSTKVRNIMIRAVARIFNLEIMPFDDPESAKQWLINKDFSA